MKHVRLLIAAVALAFTGMVAAPAYACPNCDKNKCECAKKGKKCNCGDKCTCGKKPEALPKK